ncbi:MAG: serine protease [Treponema sp.]|nr:serine protease [Treponema sp.]
MKRFYILFIALFTALPFGIFAQQGAAALRDYVGLINQTYHPGMVAYFENAKNEYEKQGESESVKIIDLILRGAFGSGFLYADRGNYYIITNNHVVAQAHTVSITFERADETKIRIDNLKIIATDEAADLALLAFPAGQRPPVTQGLTLLTRTVEEGEDAFSAGFPGLGMTPIWQFGRGMISNASVRFPKSFDDNTMLGPYIQHTAQVDSGNSGGPLLVPLRNAPSGYAVAGVNTLSGTGRQAANYSVPVATLQTFINNALNPRPATYRAALDERVNKFIQGLGANQAVFTHINDFLSTVCVGENIEYAFEEMRTKASRSVIRTFIERSRESIIGAMGLAVAWTIESSLRGSGVIRAEVKDVIGEGEEYTVIFSISGKDVSSVWIREYGNWRIKSFGTIASGDQTLIQKREKERITAAGLIVDPGFSIEAGVALCFDRAPAALYASIFISYVAVNIFWAPENFFNVGFGYSLNIPVPIGEFGLIPSFKLGLSYTVHEYYGINKDDPSNYPSYNYYDDTDTFGDIFNGLGVFVQAGLKFTTSYVPGLFAGVAFHYNAILSDLIGVSNKTNLFNTAVMFSVGYSY